MANDAKPAASTALPHSVNRFVRTLAERHRRPGGRLLGGVHGPFNARPSKLINLNAPKAINASPIAINASFSKTENSLKQGGTFLPTQPISDGLDEFQSGLV